MRIERSVLGVLAAAFVLALIVLVAVRLGEPPPPPPEPLVLAIAGSTLGVPFWVAQREGFFAAVGLTVDLRLYQTGKLALNAMLRGEAEAATVAETPIMFAGLAGKPLRIIANFASSGETSVIARADRGITQATDLKGRRVGLNPGTTGHYFLHVLLTDQGLAESDVQIVPVPATEQAAALAAGRVDAVSAFAPYSTLCRRALADRGVTFPAGLRYTGYSSLVVAPDFTRRRPEAALRLLRATERTIVWMRGHRQQAIDLAAAGQHIEPAVVEETWDRLRPNLGLDQGFVSLLRSEAQWALAAGLAEADSVPDYRALVDTSVMERLAPESVTVLRIP